MIIFFTEPETKSYEYVRTTHNAYGPTEWDESCAHRPYVPPNERTNKRLSFNLCCAVRARVLKKIKKKKRGRDHDRNKVFTMDRIDMDDDET